jgi:DNA-binding transcriptional LysR family regulator
MLPALVQERPAILPDSGFELRHLRYFVAVAEELHFGRAAKALHISQPPLSRQIQDLERQVGAVLLNRSARSVTLTAAGRVFLTESKRILAQVYRSVETARHATIGEAGHLHVGYSLFFDSCLLPRLRSALEQCYQEAQVTFHRLTSEEQLRLLRHGALDAGLFMLPVENAGHIRIEQLFRLPAVALVPDTHALAGRNEVSLADIAADRQDNRAPQSYNDVDRVEKLVDDVRHTGSVAILPCCVRQSAGHGLRCVPIAERNADFSFGVAYRPDRGRDRDDRLLQRFLETARSVAATHT